MTQDWYEHHKKYSCFDQLNDKKRSRYQFFIDEVGKLSLENLYDFGAGPCLLKDKMSPCYIALDKFPFDKNVLFHDLEDPACWEELKIKNKSGAILCGTLEYVNNPILVVQELSKKGFDKIFISISSIHVSTPNIIPDSGSQQNVPKNLSR